MKKSEEKNQELDFQNIAEGHREKEQLDFLFGW